MYIYTYHYTYLLPIHRVWLFSGLLLHYIHIFEMYMNECVSIGTKVSIGICIGIEKYILACIAMGTIV